jgi:NAD(P)-dependent dehydrogenase (short-subunit alcohol dehydrogenase family)
MLKPPVHRLLEPSEVAGLVAFLCQDAAALINGAALSADLGQTAG